MRTQPECFANRLATAKLVQIHKVVEDLTFLSNSMEIDNLSLMIIRANQYFASGVPVKILKIDCLGICNVKHDRDAPEPGGQYQI